MKKNPGLLLLVGIICLVAGAYFYFQIDGDAINKENLEIATSATSAEEAAKLIAANNQNEVGGNSLAMFLLGFGGVITLFSAIALVKKK